MPNVDEELVNYGDDEEDVEDNVPEEAQLLHPAVVSNDRSDPPTTTSDQVHAFDPYAFN